jgi:hypothetical protein
MSADNISIMECEGCHHDRDNFELECNIDRFDKSRDWDRHSDGGHQLQGYEYDANCRKQSVQAQANTFPVPSSFLFEIKQMNHEMNTLLLAQKSAIHESNERG